MRESIEREKVNKSETLKGVQKRIEAEIKRVTRKIAEEDSEEMKAYYQGIRQGYRNVKRMIEIEKKEEDRGDN